MIKAKKTQIKKTKGKKEKYRLLINNDISTHFTTPVEKVYCSH